MVLMQIINAIQFCKMFGFELNSFVFVSNLKDVIIKFTLKHI